MSKVAIVTGSLDHLIFCPGCECAHGFMVHGESPVWRFNGDMERPTFDPSLLVRGGNEGGATVCHSFIRDGKIQFLGDCTHALKGQIVELPDWDNLEKRSSK